ncbi:thiamine transporter 2-like [Diretmus argenteus]
MAKQVTSRSDETSPGKQRRMMGFCWSRERGNRPHCTCHYGLHCAGWVGPTLLLCIYGFCSMMRPIEPFMTEFLTGTYKNLTTGQVTRQVYPVWTYSNLVLIIPVFLVTDFLRYKPIIILQGLSYVVAFLLILIGPGVYSAQLAFFFYSFASVADVGYFSYIYSMVQPHYYQRVTSYARAAVLVGYASGGLLAQLLVSLGGVSLYCLAVVTFVSLCAALLTSFFLPMPKTSLLRRETSGSGSHNSFTWTGKSRTAVRHAGRMLKRLLLDCKACYSSVTVLFFCMWWAAGRCGFYQVTGYIQVLWVYRQPQHNFTAYNGGVDGIATLSGAAASIAVGHVSLEWSVWGELVLGGFSVLIAGALFLMDLTNNIWLNYACYTLFKTFYMQLITICTFQIAKTLSRERYALVFGVNSFVGTVLQSVLTAVVINSKYLHLTITSQFFVYASYFAAIGLLFTVRGVCTVFHANQPSAGDPAERATDLPEVSRL